MGADVRLHGWTQSTLVKCLELRNCWAVRHDAFHLASRGEPIVSAVSCLGKRCGHLVDPKTRRSADSMLRMSMIAPTASVAVALFTRTPVIGMDDGFRFTDQQTQGGGLFATSSPNGRIELEATRAFPRIQVSGCRVRHLRGQSRRRGDGLLVQTLQRTKAIVFHKDR